VNDPRERPGARRSTESIGGLTEPVGVILAGGRGARIGGAKATVELRGRPLICYPLRALQSVLEDVVVIAKPDTELPSLPGVTVWIEPHHSHHPLVGIVDAIALADGRPVLICAADLPFVNAAAVRLLVECDERHAPAVIAASGGRMQPLLGRYQPSVPDLLAGAAANPAVRLLDAIGGLNPRIVELEDPEVLFNVNTPDDLLQASAMLDRR
jgi:molybdenum cofactor guanylyltransferase